MKNILGLRSRAFAEVKSKRGVSEGARIGGVFTCVCKGPDGKIRWVEKVHNAVTTEMMDTFLYLIGILTTVGVYSDVVGVDLSALTFADIGGDITEFTDYSGYPTRPVYVAETADQEISNAANPAEFLITTGGTVKGLFTVYTSDTDHLLSICAFTEGDRVVNVNDTLAVVYECSIGNA